MKPVLFSTFVFIALAGAGCADMQNRPNSAVPGSTYVNAVRNSGSYGNQSIEARTRVGGERTWQGRKVFVYERPANPQGDLVTDAATGNWIAFAKGDTPTASWEPPIGFDWPLAVGKTWTRKHRFTNHVTKQSFEFTGTWKVEAQEAVTVRAGTFQAYKVVYSDTLGNENTMWSSPEIGIFVKSSNRRTAKHPAGPGTQEIELVSRPAMP